MEELKRLLIKQHREYRMRMNYLARHLVHFRLTVSSHAQQAFRSRIQHRYDSFRIIAFRQIIARPVVKKVSQKDQPVRAFCIKALHQHFTENS